MEKQTVARATLKRARTSFAALAFCVIIALMPLLLLENVGMVEMVAFMPQIICLYNAAALVRPLIVAA